jgi:hypothetical protein
MEMNIIKPKKLATNETILSGDIDQNDGADFANNDGNSFHVILIRKIT